MIPGDIIRHFEIAIDKHIDLLKKCPSNECTEHTIHWERVLNDKEKFMKHIKENMHELINQKIKLLR